MVELRKRKKRDFAYDDDPVIIIGIDFGTTYSGVAWARSGQPDVISPITHWKSVLNYTFDKEKVPTQICYDASGKPSSWGFGIPPGEPAVKWFKLLLLDAEDLPHHLRQSQQFQEVRAQLLNMDKDVVEVIGDYLGLLWEHTMESIERTLGGDLFMQSRFKVVVTLPAIWPVHVQPRMRQAVALAGILDDRLAGETTLSFIPEPEAAALASMEDMVRRPDIQNRDHFVICDAGGGTVDLISYTIVKKDPMVVQESVKGDGDLCGAMVLDRGFNDMLQSFLPPGALMRCDPRSLAQVMNDQWENGMKVQFSGNEEAFTLHLPFALATIYGQVTELAIQREDLEPIYMSAAQQVATLVSQQISNVKKTYRKLPKFVILVGGYGKSQYLHKYLKDEMQNFKTIDVLQASGNRPWTAVCRGAVIKGLTENDLGTRFGVSEADIHDERDRFWDHVEQLFRANDQTHWFLFKGRRVTGDPVSYFFYQNLEKATDEITTELIYSEASPPPKRCDKSVKILCLIRWSRVPDFETLPLCKNEDGDYYRQLHYEVEIRTEGPCLDIAIYYNGE